ncbi:MAG: hypothetical protein WC975_04985 [Phycisphaerae bacterium]
MPLLEGNYLIIFVGVAVVAIILLMRGSMRRIKGKSALSSQEAANRIPSLQNQMEVRDHLQKLMVNLQDLARQINGHIDTRFCKLEVLIKEADEKIRQLRAMGFGGKLPGEPAAGGQNEIKTDTDREMIYKLADMGKTSVEIAQELKKNTGEIELILSLRRSSRGGSSKIDYRIG